MRISALAATAGVPLPTVKFYLREGLLAPGRRLSATQAEYDETHLERLRLIRALTGTGGLDLAAVRRVIQVLDAPDPARLDVLEAAQLALDGSDAGATEGGDAPAVPTRAHAWVQARGWQIDPETPALAQLEAAWSACESAGIGLDEKRMDLYADAAERIARIDLATVPEDAADAVRQVVLGTLLVDPVLVALRRLAQQHESVSASAAPPASANGSGTASPRAPRG